MDEMINQLKNRDHFDYYVYASASIASILSTFICNIIISSSYGASGVGVFSYLKLVPMGIVTLFSFGFQFGGIYYIEKSIDKKKVIETFYGISLMMSIIIVLGVLIIKNVDRINLYNNFDYETFYFGITLWPIIFFNTTYANIMRTGKDNAKYAFLNALKSCFLIVSSLTLFVLDRNTKYIAILLIITETLLTIYLISYTIYRYRIIIPIVDKILVKKMFRFGVKCQLGNIFSFLNVRFDQLIINLFLTLENLGMYTIAMSVGESLIMVQRAIGNANLKHSISENRKIHSHRVDLIFKRMFGISIIALIFSIPVYIYFIPRLFGPEIGGSYIVYLLLLPGTAAISSISILGSTLTGYGYPMLPSLASMTSVIITITLDLVFIPKFGIIGAAVASSIANITQGVIIYKMYRRKIIAVSI